MIAYKFLAPGGRGPFTGFAWPTPRGGEPGAWVAATGADLARRGIHACRPEHLPLWPDDELWEVELAGVIETAPFQVVSSRGRLLRRVDAWDARSRAAYAAACAFRARDLAAEALVRAGHAADAVALEACAGLDDLAREAAQVAGDHPPFDPRGLAGYAAGSALRAAQGRAPEASLHHVNLAAARAGAAGAAAERAWQARWLAAHLCLRDREV